jgi:hypothetical protein
MDRSNCTYSTPASFTAPRHRRQMSALILIASVVLPLLPVVLFPTRFFGRGTGMTLVGAGLLVGLMMLIYWSLSAFTAPDTSGSDIAALAGVNDADIAALEKLF